MCYFVGTKSKQFERILHKLKTILPDTWDSVPSNTNTYCRKFNLLRNDLNLEKSCQIFSKIVKHIFKFLEKSSIFLEQLANLK
jgi:hypothetical protein